MITINKASQRRRFGHGNFEVNVTFPGVNLNNPDDIGLLNLGRIDHAILKPGAFIGMHQHINDEILSLLKSGTMLHKDSTGKTVKVTASHLMMMNAGYGIFHEESIPTETYRQNVEMLQIFIRPAKKDEDPDVQFADIPMGEINKWRLLAGYATAPLIIRSEIYVLDVTINNKSIEIPFSHYPNSTILLYVFNGSIDLVEKYSLSKGDSAVITGNEQPLIYATDADVIAFVMNSDAVYTREGMFSGLN